MLEPSTPVPRKRLLAKLKAYCLDGLVLKWIEAFLESRKQIVVQSEIISDWVKIFSCVIAALLFVLYVIDISSKLPNVTQLYDDDTKMLAQLSSEICATNLQTDLDNTYKWPQTWLLLFNVSKFVIMHYGHNNKNISYYINSIPLAESNTERDLGVLFSTNLKWKNQVFNACNKAN